MKMKRMVAAVVIAAILGGPAAVPANAAVSVTNVVCRQRYPWNGLVDIDYTVVSDDPNAEVYVVAYGEDRTTGESVNVRTCSGEGADRSVKPGRHRITWNAKVDAPSFHSDDFVLRLTPFLGAAPYLVLDLSNDGDILFRYSTRPPDLSDDACRTTEMWFRLIPPGTFTMGGKPSELGYSKGVTSPLREVTLTEPFYMAVFECTQRQWELVTHSTVTNGINKRPDLPVNASYDDVCGRRLGAQWPASDNVDNDSFLGVLRARSRLHADIPTEAQWEYTCRAGTDTGLNSGHDISSTEECPYASEVARYSGSRMDAKNGFVYETVVGSYKSNNWGLYDMHGNVREWCRDLPNSLDAFAVTNPVGPATSWAVGRRICRGGSWWEDAVHLSAWYRSSLPSDQSDTGRGFRVIVSLPGSKVD